MINIAIILAAGKGNRMGNTLPKQLIKVKNKTILEYSIEAFEKHKDIDEIAIIANKDYIEDIRNIIGKAGYIKVRHITEGGDERYLSTLAALNLYKKMNCNLIIHDSVRPLISQRIISDVISALENYDAVSVAIPVTNTIFQSDSKGNFIKQTLDRNLLFSCQTPQAFKSEILRDAFHMAILNKYTKATDDCGIVMHFYPETKIKIVQGDTKNIKITFPEDIRTMENFIEPATKTDIGHKNN